MNKFLDNIGSTYWWISVVVVGVLINIVSAYLKKRLDSYFSRASSRWRQRSERRRAERLANVEHISRDPHEQMLTAFDEMRARIMAVYGFVVALFFFGLVTVLNPLPAPDSASLVLFLRAVKIVFFLGGVIKLLMAISWHRMGVEKRLILFEARAAEKPKA